MEKIQGTLSRLQQKVVAFMKENQLEYTLNTNKRLTVISFLLKDKYLYINFPTLVERNIGRIQLYDMENDGVKKYYICEIPKNTMLISLKETEEIILLNEWETNVEQELKRTIKEIQVKQVFHY